ncbi:MAG: hypothetical protein RJB66_1425 [Pseudomonadota bacterium]|jgi:hypothetical protein
MVPDMGRHFDVFETPKSKTTLAKLHAFKVPSSSVTLTTPELIVLETKAPLEAFRRTVTLRGLPLSTTTVEVVVAVLPLLRVNVFCRVTELTIVFTIDLFELTVVGAAKVTVLDPDTRTSSVTLRVTVPEARAT